MRIALALPELAGKAGHVTSVVTDPNADPHDYESSSGTARAFADADYVVVNGAGYDTWADKLALMQKALAQMERSLRRSAAQLTITV